MLARYRIVRGKRPANDPLPDGVRMDTRKHTRHVLRPTPEMVEEVLDGGDFARFRAGYRALLDERFATDRAPFDALAERARAGDVHLGCSCPTKRQPDVSRCHTALALEWMKERYPDLEVRAPAQGKPAMSTL